MFNLIISIISIALIALTAVAGVFFGGEAFNKGSAGAVASTYINQGQQLNGAAALYANANAGVQVTDVADLQGEYLASLPSSPSQPWVLEAAFDVDGSGAATDTMPVFVVEATDPADISMDVCEKVNERDSGTGTARIMGCVTVDDGTDATAGTEDDLRAVFYRR